MLVALAVFSLAALALLRLQGFTLRTAGDLDRRALAQLVARNIQVETMTDPGPPPLGGGGGVVANGGRQFAWTRVVQRDRDPRFLLVTVSVGGGPGTSPAVLTFVRRGQ